MRYLQHCTLDNMGIVGSNMENHHFHMVVLSSRHHIWLEI